jgi:hypothetical protein
MRSFRRAAAAACLLILPLAARAVDPNLRVYADEYPAPSPPRPANVVVVGLDVGPAPMSTLGGADAAAVEALTSWDFSALAGQRVILQVVPVEDPWSCYVPDPVGPPQCGFSLPGNDQLWVRDNEVTGTRGCIALDFNGSDALERAQVIGEGTPGELRLCFNPSAHPDLPFFSFPHPDGARWFVQEGDAWQSAVFSCNTDPLNVTSGSPCPSFAGGQSASFTDGNGTLGRATGRCVQAGTLTLPSGHVVDSLLVELLASFNINALCFFPGGRIRLYQLMWLIPHYGVIAQASSAQDTASLAAWTTAESTSVGYGLLPPVDVQITGTTATSIDVSWDPGRLTDFIDGYEVQWGMQSGSVAGLPNTLRVAAPATSATIPGLSPDTVYFVSVISLRTYHDPIANVDTDYASIALPRTIGADIDGDGIRDTQYPVERSARTLAGVAEALAVNRQVDLSAPGPNAQARAQFAAACQQPPFAVCPDVTVPGSLPVTLAGEAAASIPPRLCFYEHSTPVTTMRVSRTGAALTITAN